MEKMIWRSTTLTTYSSWLSWSTAWTSRVVFLLKSCTIWFQNLTSLKDCFSWMILVTTKIIYFVWRWTKSNWILFNYLSSIINHYWNYLTWCWMKPPSRLRTVSSSNLPRPSRWAIFFRSWLNLISSWILASSLSSTGLSSNKFIKSCIFILKKVS